MKEKTHVVIIHGAYGSPSENWFPWLGEELKKEGYKVSIPAFSTPNGQSLSNWLSEFNSQIGELDKNMILVGHSLAPGFILNLLERSIVKISAVFFVSAFLGKLHLSDFDPINESFVCREFDWKKIRSNVGDIFIYNSDNDPYVPLKKGEEIAEKLGVQLNVIHNGGHINAAAGFTEIPFLLDDIKKYLK